MIAPVASNCSAGVMLLSCSMLASAPSMIVPATVPTIEPGAAEEARAADHDGGDRGQLVAGAVIGAAEVELAGMDDAGERRGEAGDRIDRDLDGRDRDAGEPRRALIAADGEDVAAEARGVEHEGGDHGDDEEDQGRDRHDVVEQAIAEDGEDGRREARARRRRRC